MRGSKLKEITFGLENCDWITIPGKYVGSFTVTDIKKYIARRTANYVGEYEVAESFMIEIHKDANTEHRQFGELTDGKLTKFGRIREWADITNVDFTIEESWTENGVDLAREKKYSYSVDWHPDDEFDNRYQKTHISGLGHMYIVISSEKDLFDVFNKEEIEDEEYMELRFDWLEISCDRGDKDEQ